MEYDDTIALIVAALPAGGGQPASSSFPTFPAAAAAIVGPVVFLAGAAFVWPRRG